MKEGGLPPSSGAPRSMSAACRSQRPAGRSQHATNSQNVSLCEERAELRGDLHDFAGIRGDTDLRQARSERHHVRRKTSFD